MTSVEDRVKMLEQFVLEDDQPFIEGPSAALAYISEADPVFADGQAYVCRWTEESPNIKMILDTLNEGKKYINLLYTYRSCSKALPQVKAQDDPNKGSIYEKTFEVLAPEIEKLKQFQSFQLRAVESFRDLVAAYTQDRKKLPSEELVHHMILMLDMFSTLDDLKNMKACLNNDFSFYKRAFQYLQKAAQNPEEEQANHSLYLFLAHQYSISKELKDKLHEVKGSDRIIHLMAHNCAHFFETRHYLLPGDKHCLLRVMPYALFLLDSDKDQSQNIFRNKKMNVNLSKYQTICRRYPVVPLYGDMQSTLEAHIRRCPHYEERLWPIPTHYDSKVLGEYSLLNHVGQIRQQHTEFLGSFGSITHPLQAPNFNVKSLPMADLEQITNVVLRGIRLISNWVAKVQEQSAIKYATPAAFGGQRGPDGQLAASSSSAQTETVEYERVVRLNYNAEERYALIEVLAMIKGLAATLLRAEGLIEPVISRFTHDKMQFFIQSTLRPMIYHASKKKRAIRMELLQLRQMCADWADGKVPTDPALFGQKGGNPKDLVKIAPRAIGPSNTQLSLFRSTLYGLLSHRRLKKNGLYSDKDFSGGAIRDIEEIYAASYFWEPLLNYGKHVSHVTDLADLWYKEFYLELSKRIQFPIEMSLPWILTDHILESHDVYMQEYVLYPLDVYNDAAHRALTALQKRFLFDEIEAEVNLCFDQLVFKLSDKTYSYFKTRASSMLLNSTFRSQYKQYMNASAGGGSSRSLRTPRGSSSTNLNDGGPADGESQRYDDVFPPPTRFTVLIKQRHFQILGRSIDLNHLIAQRMTTEVRKNIDYAISRFAAQPITAIVELEAILDAIHLTYDLMSEYFQLDPWDNLFHEANNSTSLASFHGRVVLHVLLELVQDFFPNFLFNSQTQRFTRTPLSMAEDPLRDPMPRAAGSKFMFGAKSLTGAYAAALKLYEDFFTTEHLLAMIRIVGKQYLPLVIEECLQNADLKIENVLSPYVSELSKGMPPNSKLPMHDYGTDGCFRYFSSKLGDLIGYSELRTDVFNHFKEFGNTVIFLNLLDRALKDHELSEFIAAAPLLGFTPETLEAYRGVDPNAASPLYYSVHTLATAFQGGGARVPAVLNDLVTSAWHADKFYRPDKENRSFFKTALVRIAGMIERVRPAWSIAPQPGNGFIDFETTLEFYRLWSACQYVYCFPTRSGELASHELFGDGLLWAGATIMHFLDQRRRFDVFDFSEHVIRVEDGAAEQIPLDDVPDHQNLHQFFQKAIEAKELVDQTWAILDLYAPRPPRPLVLCHPPDSEPIISHLTLATATAAAPSVNSAPGSARRASPAPPIAASSSSSSNLGFPPPPPTTQVAASSSSSFPPPPPPR